MDSKDTNQGPFPPPDGELKDRRNLHIQAVVNWMVTANGGHLPAPGAPDKAIDSLMHSIGAMSLDSLQASIPEDVRGQVPGFAHLTEDALKSIVLEAAKLSVTDENTPASETQQGDEQQQERRCWTTGASECSCRMPARLVDGMSDEGSDVLCGMDCPAGCSQADIAAAGRPGQREEFSPCCGEPGCVCTSAEDHDFWLCVGCGQATCACVPGSVEHDYDPFCMRTDCTCLNNQLPGKEDIISSTFGDRFEEDEDVIMYSVDE